MRTRLRSLTGFIIIALIISGFCLGCAGVQQKFDGWQSALREKLNFKSDGGADAGGRKDNEAYFHHTCRWSWETLDCIADWYTGDAKNAGKLADLNPDTNSAKIPVGSQVIIPVSMLKTRQPLPSNYAKVYRNRRGYYKHTVQWPGESLSLIASWYTGSSNNWRQLAQANPGLNPNTIKGGNVVMIPPSLLKTRAPLPQKVAAKYTSDYFAYKVKEDNEKLADIARWYTGDSANRNLLARANPDLDPNHLVRGNEVYIPKKLLHKPPAPKPAAPLAKPVAEKTAAEPQSAPTTDENIKLFGPKKFSKQ